MSKFDNTFNNSKLGFEELFSKTRDVAESINKKGAQAIDLSRKKFEYLDTKAKLSKLYEKYGRLHFSAAASEPIDNEELDSIFEEISSYRERLNVLKAELEDTSDIKDTTELKRGAEELKKEVMAASAEAREALKGVYKNAKEVLKNVQTPPKAEEQPEVIEVTATEVDSQDA